MEQDLHKEVKDAWLSFTQGDGDFEIGLLRYLQLKRISFAVQQPLGALLHGGSGCVWSPFLVMHRAGKWRLNKDPDSEYQAAENHQMICHRFSTRVVTVQVCDSVEAISVPMAALRVVSLPYLITWDLRNVGEHGDAEQEEVIELVHANDLDESFLMHLPTELHPLYTVCLRFARQRYPRMQQSERI